jgi:hypothetical protein
MMKIPADLKEWKRSFKNAIDIAGRSSLSDAESNDLLQFVMEYAHFVLYADEPPSPPVTAPEPERDDQWGDLGYQERREADDEYDVPF